jgi:hypothetical protein
VSRAVLSLSKSGESSEVICKQSTLGLEINIPGSEFANVETTVTYLTFGECDYTPTVTALGNV